MGRTRTEDLAIELALSVADEQASGSVDEAQPLGPTIRSRRVPAAADTVLARARAIAQIDIEAGPGRSPSSMLGQVIDGRYELNTILGKGGMGLVFGGRHVLLNLPIAVKIMLPEVATLPDYLRRFRREARAMSAIAHRNVVRVYDFGTANELPFIVMEFLEGRSLESWIDDHDGLRTLAEIDAVMQQVFDAFEVAHVAGVVHRDVKPGNMYLAQESDGREVLKVLDFGLAHFDDGTEGAKPLTQAGMVSGTPTYMSPEQCRSLQVDASTDLYALGCVLTEFLQRAPPFIGASSMEIMTQQMLAIPPPLARPLGSEPIPPLLERLRLDLLAKLPARRPQSVGEVRHRWDEALSSEAHNRKLPRRKLTEEAGGRQDRAPQWSAAEAHVVVAPPVDSLVSRIALLWVAGQPSGIDDHCRIGLAAAGFMLSTVGVEESAGFDAYVLDAGSSGQEACRLLGRLAAVGGGGPVIVCLRDFQAGLVADLIAAGANDIVSLPADVSQLVRKLRRLRRDGVRRPGAAQA